MGLKRTKKTKWKHVEMDNISLQDDKEHQTPNNQATHILRNQHSSKHTAQHTSKHIKTIRKLSVFHLSFVSNFFVHQVSNLSIHCTYISSIVAQLCTWFINSSSQSTLKLYPCDIQLILSTRMTSRVYTWMKEEGDMGRILSMHWYQNGNKPQNE